MPIPKTTTKKVPYVKDFNSLQFQQWMNKTRRGLMKEDGVKGPRTQSAYEQFGAEYEKLKKNSYPRVGPDGKSVGSDPMFDIPAKAKITTTATTPTITKNIVAPTADIKYPKLAVKKKTDWKGMASKAAPFISNIVNSFRKPPKPKQPNMDNQIALKRVNLDNDRAVVERGIRGANLEADVNLSENTAAAVKSNNLATQFNQMSAINQSERNQNVAIDNQTEMINAQIRASNNAKRDGYDASVIERKVAMQTQASANLANAGDKLVGIQNERVKRDLELKKEAILMRTDYRGVLARDREKRQKTMDEIEESGQGPTYKNGGKIKPFNSKRMITVLK